jgi:hypothetical protein
MMHFKFLSRTLRRLTVSTVECNKIHVEIVFKYEFVESFPQCYAAPVSTATGAETRPFVIRIDEVLTNPNTGQ